MKNEIVQKESVELIHRTPTENEKVIMERLCVDLNTYLTLKTSIYPGAKDESIEMALSYCRSLGLDPLHKPVHIVPMRVKDSRTGEYVWIDQPMPGITLYRILATRSGSYLGKNEPEFGPDVTETIGGVNVTYPKWCRVTVKKLVTGHVCEFTAREFWKENFASTKDGRPNTMWQKRAYAQLAKCTEAQALRMAWPELIGGMPTAEEMHGKDLEGRAIDVTAYHVVGQEKQITTEPELVTPWQIDQLKELMVQADISEKELFEKLNITAYEQIKEPNWVTTVKKIHARINQRNKQASLQVNKMFAEFEPKIESKEAKNEQVIEQ